MATSNVTVPVFGFGIRPRGPSTRPSRPTLPIWSGVAIATSKSVKPSSIALGEVGGADDVGAGLLGLARLVALGEDGDALLAAGAVREHHRPAQLLVRVADVEPEVHVHLDRLVELRARRVLEQPDRLDGRVDLLAVDRAARFA